MIIEYNKRYDEDIKDLFVELQEFIASIDKERYNILTPNFREEYFQKTLQEIEHNSGKMLLFEEDKRVIGLVVGLIRKETFECGFHAPQRGEITELIVSKHCRAKGYGKALLSAMEQHLYKQGCKNIILGVFGYNDHAIEFYKRNGYNMRFIDMTRNFK